MTNPTSAGTVRHLIVCAFALGMALALGMSQSGAAAQRGEPGEGTRGQGAGPAGRGRANYSLSDPAPNDPALKGAIDMHAHQDPDSFGPSYGQAARSIDALDLYTRAKATSIRQRGWPITCASSIPTWRSSAGWDRTSQPAPR